MNQTAGLFGGLILAASIGAAVIYVSPEARAWIAQKLTGASATSSGSSSSAPAGTATPPAPGSGGGLFGTFFAPLAVNQVAPYQLQLTSNGVGLTTAAMIPANEAPAIPLPSLASLAPTSPGLVYA